MKKRNYKAEKKQRAYNKLHSIVVYLIYSTDSRAKNKSYRDALEILKNAKQVFLSDLDVNISKGHKASDKWSKLKLSKTTY